MGSEMCIRDRAVSGKAFLLDRSYYGFQPNSFEYNLWCDHDMPDVLKRDSEVAGILGYTESNNGDNNARTSAKLSKLLSSSPEQDEESITFSSAQIKEFDQVDNKFIYSVTRNGVEVQLHVTRNDPVKDWRYNPNAF